MKSTIIAATGAYSEIAIAGTGTTHFLSNCIDALTVALRQTTVTRGSATLCEGLVAEE